MKINKNIVLISRVIVGLTFIFSGFVKAVDPIGSMIKIKDYLIAFNLPWMEPFALFFAIILCVYEFPLGIGILSGVKSQLMSWLVFPLMIFFTFLTLYLAIENPVSDCGCFGDAIKLTNWQTFYKNLILIPFVVIIFLNRSTITPLFKKPGEWATVLFGTLVILLICFYGVLYEPFLDFRAYKKGNDIEALMTLPEGVQGDVYETVLLFKDTKTGKIKEFDENNIPMDDQWQWLETKSELVKKGAEPKTKDFKLTDSTGADVTGQFLAQSGYKLLIVQHKLSHSNPKAQAKLNELFTKLQEDAFIKVYAATSSLTSEITEFSKKNQVPYSFFNADIVLLETIIRSNPGVILFKDNVVVQKWPFRKIPDFEKLSKIVFD